MSVTSAQLLEGTERYDSTENFVYGKISERLGSFFFIFKMCIRDSPYPQYMLLMVRNVGQRNLWKIFVFLLVLITAWNLN